MFAASFHPCLLFFISLQRDRNAFGSQASEVCSCLGPCGLVTVDVHGSSWEANSTFAWKVLSGWLPYVVLMKMEMRVLVEGDHAIGAEMGTCDKKLSLVQQICVGSHSCGTCCRKHSLRNQLASGRAAKQASETGVFFFFFFLLAPFCCCMRVRGPCAPYGSGGAGRGGRRSRARQVRRGKRLGTGGGGAASEVAAPRRSLNSKAYPSTLAALARGSERRLAASARAAAKERRADQRAT